MKAYLSSGGGVIVAIGVCLFGASSGSERSFLDPEAISAAWESTYASIETMSVSYSTVLEDYRPPTSNPQKPPPVKYTHVKRVEAGKRYHIRFSTAETGFDDPESLTERAFDGTVTRDLWAAKKSGSIFLGLNRASLEKKNSLKEFMLLETHPTRVYLKDRYPNGVPGFLLTLTMGIANKGVMVRPYLESVAGELCHVVEVVLSGRNHEGIPRQFKRLFWVAHDKGMCLMKYQAYEDANLCQEMEVEQLAAAETDGSAIWYPQKAHMVLLYEETGMTKRKLNVTEFVPNGDVDDNTFRFSFPTGTHVYDEISGISFVVAGADPDGEVSPVHVIGPVETARAANTTLEEPELATEGNDSQESTDNKEAGQINQIPTESAVEKGKMLRGRTLAILGVGVLVAFGLLIWYRRTF